MSSSVGDKGGVPISAASGPLFPLSPLAAAGLSPMRKAVTAGLLSLCCVLLFIRRSRLSPSGARARGCRLVSILQRLLWVLGFDGVARRAATATSWAVGRRPPRPALPCPDPVMAGRGTLAWADSFPNLSVDVQYWACLPLPCLVRGWPGRHCGLVYAQVQLGVMAKSAVNAPSPLVLVLAVITLVRGGGLAADCSGHRKIFVRAPPFRSGG